MMLIEVKLRNVRFKQGFKKKNISTRRWKNKLRQFYYATMVVKYNYGLNKF